MHGRKVMLATGFVDVDFLTLRSEKCVPCGGEVSL